MHIRHATIDDLPRIMEIYAGARSFMAATGNPNQWGPTNWPPEALIRQDIARGNSYVCVSDAAEGVAPGAHADANAGVGRVIGVFFFAFGPDIEPTYRVITDGAWREDGPYGVVHRLAGDGSVPGIGTCCITWAFNQCGHLRIDTHPDNRVMQGLLAKLGFVHCGTIHVEEDDYPRLAFEKIAPEQPVAR